ncbi:Phosphoenolpyruvate-protein phosphotransferase [Hartmannibacter diazotrophicus]|uniref:phosphoenolpyruvate--protein phosphotransferase n=1 Tax=Hartmannibacter diazotrophicus TaxID=1482074 RepID=A0A2C9DAW5_9HYPH|nr:phosphoenolpyruvate--protein phosphotransferase [Hartmannibacter diazotrophicus]SON57310.1 Phosphoenolpyruvate-protein phosphotransferase [Hartmannibacter diazotrophicus]
MRGTLVGPRVLLRRLREVMAEPISAQDRLNKIVVVIAANMVAEVCSVYVLRGDGVLELYATEGLNPDSVHKAGLRLGQGLVGHIAEDATALNLPDAQLHPEFAYLPETGEEIYHSFLGVPILRAGRTLGVLVVQNKVRKSYSEEEEEALQTTAMVIAEMIAAGELSALSPEPNVLEAGRPVSLSGVGLSDGVGLGYVVLHEPRVVVTNLIAEDPEAEIKRLEAALSALRESVDNMLAKREVSHHGEHRDVLEAYRMFAYDRGWVRRMEEAVLRSGLTAEAAVERVQSDTRAKMMRQSDPYLRERLHDFDDLTFRLLRELIGKDHQGEEMPKDSILVARNMGPAELLDYDRTKLRGLVLEEGSPSSHVAIVARALNIAAVAQVPDVVALAEDGDAIIVDGELAQVHLRPPPEVEQAFVEKVKFRAKRQERYRQLRDFPAETKDGVRVGLMMNAGLVYDMPHLDESGAEGVGLFRTELQFMLSSNFPRTSVQQQFYSRVLDAAGDRPVTFRTLDIGGDKVLPYIRATAEENPALGWRAVRLGLDRPALLRSQLRALLKAASGRNVRVMFPMVSEIDEFRRARDLVEKELAHLDRFGYERPAQIELGVMIEVPSLLFCLDELFREVDFASVGSNDLFQFMLAVDRGNAAVSSRFDPLSPAFLRALRLVAERAAAAEKPVALCGELAGQPLTAMILAGLGYRSISMTPASVGPVKAMMRELTLAPFRSLLDEMLDPLAGERGAEVVRRRVVDFAAQHGVPLSG